MFNLPPPSEHHSKTRTENPSGSGNTDTVNPDLTAVELVGNTSPIPVTHTPYLLEIPLLYLSLTLLIYWKYLSYTCHSHSLSIGNTSPIPVTHTPHLLEIPLLYLSLTLLIYSLRTYLYSLFFPLHILSPPSSLLPFPPQKPIHKLIAHSGTTPQGPTNTNSLLKPYPTGTH